MNLLKAANPVTFTKGVFGLAGTAVGLTGTVVREAIHAPIGVTKGAIDLADSAAGLVGSIARETAHVLWPNQDEEHGPSAPEADSAAVSGDPNVPGPTTAAAVDAAVRDVAGAPPGPTTVPVEPHAPEEPPVDVVGQALAAEQAGDLDGAGMAHEAHGASRNEEHGHAPLQRAEVDEIAEEATAALEGDLDPEPHLTEPLLDSADAKAVAAELSTMSKAADPHKD